MQGITGQYQWYKSGQGSSFTMEPCTHPAAIDNRVILPAG